MNKLNGVPEIEKERQKSIIEHLSLQAIKLKLNCLFNCRNKTPLCACGTYINNEHVIKDWTKTQEWRVKWNIITAAKIKSSNIHDILLKDHEEPESFDLFAPLINKATEDLISYYLGNKQDNI